MKIENITKHLLIIFIVISGLLIGSVIRIFAHETGHFIFAYIFNKEGIKSFDPHIENAIYQWFNQELIVNPSQVEYVKDMRALYTFPQLTIILLGGLTFDLILFILTLKLLEIIQHKQFIYFIYGVLFSFITLGIWWSGDANKLLLLFTENQFIRFFLLFAVTSALVFIWFYFISKWTQKLFPLNLKYVDTWKRKFIKSSKRH